MVEKRNLTKVLFIDAAVDKVLQKYSTLTTFPIRNLEEAQSFLEEFALFPLKSIHILDMRGASMQVYSFMLKYVEECPTNLLVYANEPISPPFLSRFVLISKITGKLKKFNPLRMILRGSPSILAKVDSIFGFESPDEEIEVGEDI